MDILRPGSRHGDRRDRRRRLTRPRGRERDAAQRDHLVPHGGRGPAFVILKNGAGHRGTPAPASTRRRADPPDAGEAATGTQWRRSPPCSPRFRFRAAPARAARFTFAVVGDFGSGNRNEVAVASMIESWHADFVLTTGDNAYPLGTSLLDRDIFGLVYAAIMRESAWFPALGNHDVRANGGKPELEAFHSLGAERCIGSPGGPVAVVVLDSDVSVGPGRRSCAFARSSLALPSWCFRFAAWHHPPWEPPGNRVSPGLRRTSCARGEGTAFRWCSKATWRYARSRRHHGVLYVARGHGGSRVGARRRKLTIPSDASSKAASAPCGWTSPAGTVHGSATRPSTEGTRRLPPELFLATGADFFRSITHAGDHHVAPFALTARKRYGIRGGDEDLDRFLQRRFR